MFLIFGSRLFGFCRFFYRLLNFLFYRLGDGLLFAFGFCGFFRSFHFFLRYELVYRHRGERFKLFLGLFDFFSDGLGLCDILDFLNDGLGLCGFRDF